ncbi:MAG: hypothetical protein AAGD25_10935 [Cyanobacteria bacterium P01_F01_bin.150]
MLQSTLLEQTLLNYVRILPVEQQQAVLDFAAFLNQKKAVQLQYGIEGSCVDLEVDLNHEDISALRTELSSSMLQDVEL